MLTQRPMQRSNVIPTERIQEAGKSPYCLRSIPPPAVADLSARPLRFNMRRYAKLPIHSIKVSQETRSLDPTVHAKSGLLHARHKGSYGTIAVMKTPTCRLAALGAQAQTKQSTPLYSTIPRSAKYGVMRCVPTRRTEQTTSELLMPRCVNSFTSCALPQSALPDVSPKFAASGGFRRADDISPTYRGSQSSAPEPHPPPAIQSNRYVLEHRGAHVLSSQQSSAAAGPPSAQRRHLESSSAIPGVFADAFARGSRFANIDRDDGSKVGYLFRKSNR